MQFGLLLPLIVAVLDWIALYRKWPILDAFAKPGVMLALLLLVWLTAPEPLQIPALLWLQIGLLFSLIGDILLMLPRERFLGGLVAFLLAHLAYVRAFSFHPLQITPLFLASCLLIALVAVLIFRQLFIGMQKSGRSRMLLPTGIYALVITMMFLAGVSTWFREGWIAGAALLVSLGAAFFYLSDTLLAWNRFIRQLPRGRLVVRIFYHLGQYAIVTGVLLGTLEP